MLSLLTGEELAEDTKLMKPLESEYSLLNEIRRPELTWFDAQNNQLGIQEEALKVGYLPRLGLFVQGAYGNPGLNMLKDCLLYTSDAADDLLCGDLGGRRIIKKKNIKQTLQ